MPVILQKKRAFPQKFENNMKEIGKNARIDLRCFIFFIILQLLVQIN